MLAVNEVTPGGAIALTIYLVLGSICYFWPVWAFFILIWAIRNPKKTEKIVYIREPQEIEHPEVIQWTPETAPKKRIIKNWDLF